MTENDKKIVPLRPNMEDVLAKITPEAVNQFAYELIRFANEIGIALLIIGFKDHNTPVVLASDNADDNLDYMIQAVERVKLKLIEEINAETD
jgi:hypothetical protein